VTTDVVPAHRVQLHRLTYVDEGRDSVLVGRPDTGSYGLFPTAGAEILRRLEAGVSLESGGRWWRERTGKVLDLDDFRATLDDLGFLVGRGAKPVEGAVLGWQRLAWWLFAPPAWVLYALVVAAALVAMIRDASLRPSYHATLSTAHLPAVLIVLAVGQLPLLLLHEAFHVLAARRLGLPATLAVGRRHHHPVVEATLDCLYSVPRRQRYLPLLAGVLVDTVGIAVWTLVAAAGRSLGAPPWVGALALASAATGVVRLALQCLCFVETDLYVVLDTATGCDDLRGAARYLVRSRLAALRPHRRLHRRPRRRPRRRPPTPGPGAWTAHDLAVARWYAPAMVAGYAISLSVLLVWAVPTAWTLAVTVVSRLSARPLDVGTVVDVVALLAFGLIDLGLLAALAVRDRRRRPRSTRTP